MAYYIVRQENLINYKYAKAGVDVNGSSVLTLDSIQTLTDPTFKWVLNDIPEPVNGGRTTISQLNKDLYWVRGYDFVVGGKNYTSIELASKLSTQPALEVILNSRSPLGGYDLYTPSNEYIISVYAPEYQSTKICLSATPIDTFAWSWLFNKVL